jgi:hypothetical protein
MPANFEWQIPVKRPAGGTAFAVVTSPKVPLRHAALHAASTFVVRAAVCLAPACQMSWSSSHPLEPAESVKKLI